MWDLTVPGDHDFYVVASPVNAVGGNINSAAQGSAFVLVHNDDGCAIDPPYEEPTELHHILPQQYRSYFEGAGRNIDEVTAELPQSIHQAAHDVGWNESWGTFINQNPNASASEITAQASSMLQEYGLDQYILGTLPYR